MTDKEWIAKELNAEWLPDGLLYFKRRERRETSACVGTRVKVRSHGLQVETVHELVSCDEHDC